MRKEGYPLSFRLSWAGKTLPDNINGSGDPTTKTLADYNIQKETTIHLDGRPYQSYSQYIVVEVAPWDFIDSMFFEGRDTKWFHEERDSIKQLKDRVCSRLGVDYYKFDKYYDLFIGNKTYKDGQRIIRNHGDKFEIKTKDGKHWYRSYEKIHDKQCVLIVFGYLRSIEAKYSDTRNVPIAIKSIIKKYLNKNDTDLIQHGIWGPWNE